MTESTPGEPYAIRARPRACGPPSAFTRADLEQTIASRFERQAAMYPERRAIVTARQTLTYSALNRMANGIADAVLSARGPEPEPIGLLLDNDAPMIAAMLGVLKAGKFYVPLDPSLPVTRLGHIAADSEAKMVLTTRPHRALLADLAQGIAEVDLDRLDGGEGADNPHLPLTPDASCWILYTSGSTGRPKGVVQTHQNALHTIRTFAIGLGLSPEDRMSMLLSPGVNGAAHEIWSALLNGACLYPLDLRREGLTALAPWLIEHGITTYASVPTVFRHFCDTLTGSESFPRLRLIKLVGEPVLKRDVDLYRTHFPDECILVNRYGSTETGTARWYFIDKDTPIFGPSVPIGHPTEDYDVVIVNEAGDEAAPEEPGEIVVRSPYLSPGYWRRPELTDKAFAIAPGGRERMYRTGDIGRLSPDGVLTCLGRTDSQVKILGHRVELAEVEMALLELPGVSEVLAMTAADGRGEPRLVAYVVARAPHRPTAGDLRRALTAAVPAHMVPSAFVLLDQLPLAPNGKVARSALPRPDWARPELETAFVEPRTPAEATLARIWAGVLGIERVGIRDHFVDLGGHSLLAMQVFVEVEKTFGRKLPMAHVLQAPTIERMAAILVGADPIASFSSLVAIRSEGARPPFFWVHGENSTALLPRHLEPDQPLYGLVHQGQDGRPVRHTTIENIAAHYLRELSAVQPQGPYYLGGFCIGGTIAFEMAQQLSRRKQEIALLLLLDAPPPRPSDPALAPPIAPAPSAEGGGELVSRAFFPRALRAARRTARRTLDGVKELGEAVAYRVCLTVGYPLPVSLQFLYRADVYRRAEQLYVSKPFPGRITLVISEDGGRPGNVPTRWNRLAARGLDVHTVAASHDRIVFDERQIGRLAPCLKTCIETAQALRARGAGD